MTFVPPSWWMIGLIKIGYCLIPLIIGIITALYGLSKDKVIIIIIGAIIILAGFGLASLTWHNNYEVASVDEKVITVSDYQIKPNIGKNENGNIVVDSADDLLMVTTDGEAFLNEENFLFQKFDTRDVLNNAKPGSVVNLTFYGWREGFNSGFPNILSVEVLDDSHAANKTVTDYFGTKIV